MYLYRHLRADGRPLPHLDFDHDSDLFATDPVVFRYAEDAAPTRRERAALGEEARTHLGGAQPIFLPEEAANVLVGNAGCGCCHRHYRVADLSAVALNLTGPVASPVAFQKFAARLVLRSPWGQGRPLLMVLDPRPDGIPPDDWLRLVASIPLPLDRIPLGVLAAMKRPFLVTGGLRVGRALPAPCACARLEDAPVSDQSATGAEAPAARNRPRPAKARGRRG